jgi:tetratricopeptide (TPR) repeat protein
MKAAAPAPKQAPPPPPVPAPEETEIAEEIVELETLEPPALRGRPGAIAPEVREKRGPDAQEPVFDLSEEISFDLGEAAVTPPSAESTEEAVTWEPGEPEAAPPSPPEAAADDINTNTLAELYITQGFYEKAIEIYEGMLAENPGNAGLMQKLARIRAMAGVADQGAAFSAPEEMKSEGSLIEDLVVGAETAAVKEPSLPRPEEIKAPVAEQPESVEMRPAIPKQPPPEKAVTTGAPTELRGASARRKETIDRLESWLKNIMKEKS